jgi:hypothetical protein
MKSLPLAGKLAGPRPLNPTVASRGGPMKKFIVKKQDLVSKGVRALRKFIKSLPKQKKPIIFKDFKD